ncbi:uncharacterized protein [Macrobrachium rosenbergii]|uniref:uncharacterized protein n=1 Tax=Macrobrachium rosenbergii TaxID=79674 RepID=UPI0034D4DB5F
MQNQWILIGVVGVACLVGGAYAGPLEEGVDAPSEVFLESLIEIGRQSTVYNFNFNNLIIIIILKLWSSSSGRLQVGFVGRSIEDDSLLMDGSDVLFIMTYMVSSGIEKYDCLNRLACLDNAKAQDFLTASRMMIKGAKFLQPYYGYSVDKYEYIADGVQDAIDYRRQGGSCHKRYSCYELPSL